MTEPTGSGKPFCLTAMPAKDYSWRTLPCSEFIWHFTSWSIPIRG